MLDTLICMPPSNAPSELPNSRSASAGLMPAEPRIARCPDLMGWGTYCVSSKRHTPPLPRAHYCCLHQPPNATLILKFVAQSMRHTTIEGSLHLAALFV